MAGIFFVTCFAVEPGFGVASNRLSGGVWPDCISATTVAFTEGTEVGNKLTVLSTTRISPIIRWGAEVARNSCTPTLLKVTFHGWLGVIAGDEKLPSPALTA